MPPVSIIIPVYNEVSRLRAAVARVRAATIPGVEREIIVVDDGSTDGSRAVVEELEREGTVRACYHQQNRGKGAAIRTGVAAARGDRVVLHDADLEYDPAEHRKLLDPLLAGNADVVYGNRMHRGNPVGYWRYWIGNYLISLVCSLLFSRRVHDVETGAKAFRRAVLPGLGLRAERFDFEVEVTARVLQSGLRLAEVPVSYCPRRFGQGKKISWRDGVRALGLLVKYRFQQIPNSKHQIPNNPQ